MVSIRGAITIDEDTKENVLSGAEKLLREIMSSNSVDIDDIISILFTCTDDIRSAYPARAARKMGIVNASLMCLSEMNVTGSLKKCIRVMVLVNKDLSQRDVNHVYLKGAVILRPDLSRNAAIQ